MTDEYLALGGVELGNNARAYAYSQCLSCCTGLLKGDVCDGLHDATNPFTNAVRAWQERARNLATNPSMESVTSTIDFYRNLIKDPDLVNLALWSATAGTVASVSGNRFQFTSTGSSVVRLGVSQTLDAKKAAGTYTLSVNAQANDLAFTHLRVILLDTNGSAIRSTVNIPVIPGGGNNRYDFTLVSPDLWDRVYIEWVGAAIPSGAIAFIGQPIIGLRSFVVPFFSPGQGTGDPDLIAVWAGATNASETILRGNRPSTVNTAMSAANVFQSSQWAASGAFSLKVAPTGENSGSYGSLVLTGLTPGQQITIGATIHLDTPQTGTPHATWVRQLMAQSAGMVPNNVLSNRAPNVAGDHALELTITPVATSVTLFAMNGSPITPAWFDNFYVNVGPVGMFFDGNTLPAGYDPDFWRTSWLSTENASVAILEENVITAEAESDEPPYSCADIERAPWYDQSNPFSQDFAGFYLLAVKGLTDGTMTAGVTESIGGGGSIGTAHYATRSVRVRSMLIGCGKAAAEYGLAWLKAALGESFCSRHGGACGTSDLAFFIDCPPALDPGDLDYAATVSPYRRYLHDVACTSSPIISEEYETMSGAYVIIVEYILTAESPFVWGEMFEADNTGTVLTAYDDIPFNLMRRPSGEQGDGIPAIVATQYAFNGSAEYGGSGVALPTGWAVATTNIAAGLSQAKSTDIAAVGPSSARIRLLATGPVVDGTVKLYYDVNLATLPAGSAPSVSIWAAALTFAGAPTAAAITAEVEWRTGVATVSTTPLGSIPLNGGNIAAPGLTRPPTATIARLAVTLTDIDAISGDDLRFYADAFGLTVP